MRVLVLGSTGYIGSAVTARLERGGHHVVRVSHEKDGSRLAPGVRFGDLRDTATMADLVTDDIEAVVHAAAPTGSWDQDRSAVEALLEPLKGSGRPFVYLSGVWVLGSIEAGDEFSPPSPIGLVAGRELVEATVRSAQADGVRAVVVRPGIVHGGGGGIPAMMLAWAREARVGRFVGSPETRWPMVHRDDLADLVVLAVEAAPAGAVLHAVSEPAVPVLELARSVHRAVGGAGQAVAWDQADAASVIGEAFAEALALDQTVHAPVARALGWAPSRPGAVKDVATYRRAG